jgi:hypothetical protein
MARFPTPGGYTPVYRSNTDSSGCTVRGLDLSQYPVQHVPRPCHVGARAVQWGLDLDRVSKAGLSALAKQDTFRDAAPVDLYRRLRRRLLGYPVLDELDRNERPGPRTLPSSRKPRGHSALMHPLIINMK